MQIGQRIRAARDGAGLSQRQLATRLRVSPGAVARWEKGEIKPSIKRRVALSSILKIPFRELLPEAAAVNDVIRDPVVVAIVQLLSELPAPVRETILMQLAAVKEALHLPETPLPGTTKR